jgi:Domain of unknown function (DUF4440)/Domain of unknown function (DUF3471)
MTKCREEKSIWEGSVKLMTRCAILPVVMVLVACTSSRPTSITQDQLVKNTQELNDGVAAGDQTPWKKYYADDSMYFDEKGRSMDKTALVNDITPLPPGYSGSIKVVNAKSHIEADIAILSYDLDEYETIFGQNMTARYHATDTWMFRNGNWQIVAGQVLRYYEDPAPGKVDVRRYAEYAGTYELAPGVIQTVSREDDNLYAQREGRDKVQISPESTDLFFKKNVEGRYLFRRDDHGKVDALVDRRNNEDVVWKKIK